MGNEKQGIEQEGGHVFYPPTSAPEPVEPDPPAVESEGEPEPEQKPKARPKAKA